MQRGVPGVLAPLLGLESSLHRAAARPDVPVNADTTATRSWQRGHDGHPLRESGVIHCVCCCSSLSCAANHACKSGHTFLPFACCCWVPPIASSVTGKRVSTAPAVWRSRAPVRPEPVGSGPSWCCPCNFPGKNAATDGEKPSGNRKRILRKLEEKSGYALLLSRLRVSYASYR